MATPTTTGVDLMLLLSQVSHALQTELTAALEEVGLSPRAQCVLSQALAGERTQSQIAELSDLDKTTMVVTVDELEQAGYAERRPCPNDRRARIVAVTPEGERVVAEGRAIVARVYDEVLGTLDDDVRVAFLQGLVELSGGRLAEPAVCARSVRRRKM